jgi:hypothetical protein
MITSPPLPDEHKPLLAVLNFSAGRQSSCLLWQIIRGEFPKPESFAVLNANPGMENSDTYKYVEMMRQECLKAGIYFETVAGPNLYLDILRAANQELKRLDNPPYWTKDPKTGKEGKLIQGCTKYYKIQPMDRAVRRLLEDRFGISQKSGRVGEHVVEKWIGFSSDEVPRIKPPSQKYTYFRYPLIEQGLDKAKVVGYFLKNNLPLPPRSVCNACFSNGLETYKEMHEKRPGDWQQAVAIDNAVRRGIPGVDRETFVSKTLLSLEELAKMGFVIGEGEDQDGFSCDSGYCFT